MLTRDANSLGATLAVSALSLTLIGCSGTDGNSNETCSAPQLRHSPTPFSFQEAFPPPDDNADENRGDRTRTPFEATFHLRSGCEKDVDVQKTCLIGEGEETGSGKTTEHFAVEGPKPSTVKEGTDSVLRITYDRDQPNSGDDVDNAAMVIQSNAGNLPTLVVPMCARVIQKSQDASRQPVECESPVEIPSAGEKKEGLCSN